MRARARSTLALMLCGLLVILSFPQASSAAPKPLKKDWFVEMEIGQPSVWSLAQAHYLLAQIHETNRGLRTKELTQDDLNPNRANAARLEILRTLFGLEAQFDESLKTKNEAEIQKFEDKQARQEQARDSIPKKEAELRRVNQDLLQLQREEAALKTEDALADKARGTAPPTPDDLKRKVRISQLAVEITAKTNEKTAVEQQLTSLREDAEEEIGAPNVQGPGFSTTDTAIGTFPASEALTGFVTKFFNEAGTAPTLSASIALDNYLGMQYEIVAKQLSLLRDELGPEERLIFLELPASIYTVDGWADDYMAQVEWKVTRFFDQEPDAAIQEDVVRRMLKEQGENDTYIDAEISSLFPSQQVRLDRRQEGNERDFESDGDEDRGRGNQRHPITLDMIVLAEQRASLRQTTIATWMEMPQGDSKNGQPDLQRQTIPSSLCQDQITGMERQCVRALEIIPRQSALNINEYHATTSNTGLLGAFKLLSGFGLKTSFQKQREEYEKFLQQEAFASGFGKGTNRFKWVFGPLPGSRRIAPGQRTTYAVVAVPKDTLALELEATGLAFKRTSPRGRGRIVGQEKFLVRVPGEKTERFWVDAIAYTPVEPGRTVTAILEGNYFSPQLGVLINGVPLKRVRSITRVGSDEGNRANQHGIEGEFEIPNSRQMVFSFAMPSDYVGTPLITLVTPERTTAINFFDIRINHRPGQSSLQAASAIEPMFTERFKVEPTLEEVTVAGCTPAADHVLYRLKGLGLRRSAEVWVGDKKLKTRGIQPEDLQRAHCSGVTDEVAVQEGTRSYLLSFKQPNAKGWKVRYRQPSRQNHEEVAFDHLLPAGVPFAPELRNYRSQNRRAEVDLSFRIPGLTVLPKVCLDDPRDPNACPDVQKDQNGVYRVKCTIDGDERDFISVKALSRSGAGAVGDCVKPDPQAKAHFADLRLPIQPPRVQEIANLNTGKLEGRAHEEANATLRGINLHRVKGVLFGNLEAPFATQDASSEIRVVKIPRIEVPEGERTIVPVTIQTDNGAIPTGFYYTYLGKEPKKKDDASERRGSAQ